MADMDVSHLRVKVDSEGIQQTSRQLGGLGTSAQNAEKKVLKLTETVAKLSGANEKLAGSQQSATAQAQAQAAAFSSLNTAMGQILAMMNAIAASADKLGAAQRGLRQNTDAVVEGFKRKSHWGNVATSTLKAMATYTATVGLLKLAKDVGESADAWQNMHAKLNIVTKSQKNANLAIRDTFEISQKLRVPLEDTTRLFTRLYPAMGRMGRTGEETARVVQSVATALQLSGATAQESSSAMLQLSQSFNSGRLNGQEFNAVAENAPLILEAIARKMNVSIGALKKLGSEGKITGKILTEALLEVGPTWDAEFAKMPITIGGALVRIKNEWKKAIGEMGEDTQFSKAIVEGLSVVQQMIPVITGGIGSAFQGMMQWVNENKDGLKQIWEQIKLIAADLWDVVKVLSFVAGQVASVGGEVNALGFAFFSIRLAIAGVQDGFTLIGAIVLGLGSHFARLGGIVLDVLNHPVAWLIDAMSGLWSMMAKGAKLAGFDKMAESLGALAQGADAISGTLKGMGDAARERAKEMSEAAGKAIDYLSSENSAVQRVLNSQVQLNEERKKSVTGKYDSNIKKEAEAPDAAAAKAAAKAQKIFEQQADALNAKLAEQIELQDRLAKYGLEYDKISAGTKARIELEKKLHDQQLSGASALEQTRTLGLLLIAKELELQEQLNERKLEGMRAEKAATDKEVNKAKQLEEEAKTLEFKAQTYGMAKGAVEALEEAETRQRVASLLSLQEITPEQEKLLAALQAQLAARERLSAASGKIGEQDSIKALDKALDPKKAERFGDSFANAFGKIGQSITKAANLLRNFEKRQEAIADMRKNLAGIKDEQKYAEYLKKIQDQEAENSIRNYGDMAEAAKGFFDEKSKGYKILEGVEKTFRAFELAMEFQSFLQKSGLITALTALRVAGNEEAATSAVAGAATEVTATMAVANANAVAGVANQANGDPYSAFPRMAAMAAIMVALGLAVGSFGGGKNSDIAKQRQEQAGTGTVFGDASAKSESISKSIELLANNSDIALRYSSGMLDSLRNIEASLTGATNAILRSSSTLTGQGIVLGGSQMSQQMKLLLGLPALGLGSFFGTTQNLNDTGISSQAQTVKDILTKGFQAQSYIDKTVKEKAFGITYSERHRRDYSNLDPTIEQEFTRVIQSMVGGVSSAAEALGMDAEQVKKSLMGVSVALGDISLKGLSGDQIEKQLNAIFSAFGDKLVQASFGPLVAGFQKAGEGLLETAVRVAQGSEQATYELEKLGLTAVKFTDLVDKQGDVGAEIVRQTILQKEAATGVGEIISTLGGTASDIAATYKQLVDTRKLLQSVGLGNNLNRDLVRAAGGLQAMQDALEAYQDKFFTDAEKQAQKAAILSDSFSQLGLAMPATKEAFKQLVNTLQGQGQSTLAMKVLLLADSFAQLSDQAEALAGVDTARSNLNDAYEREKSNLEDVKSKFEDFGKSLKEFRDSLITGDLSPLSNTEKYATLKAQFESTRVAAMSGDESAISKFESVAQEFLQFSREYNASGSQYTEDFMKVLDATQQLEQYANGRASVAEQQLDVLKQQVSQFIDLNENVLSVVEAIQALQAAIEQSSLASTGTLTPVTSQDGTASIDPVTDRATALGVSNSNNDAMVAEIQQLRAQVAAMQASQEAQTAAVIAATYDSNRENAQSVVTAYDNSLSASEYMQRYGMNLA